MNIQDKEFKEILASKAISNKESVPMYSPEYDITFIMEIIIYEDGTRSEECVGWYYGEPDKYLTNNQVGSLLAVFDPAE